MGVSPANASFIPVLIRQFAIRAGWWIMLLFGLGVWANPDHSRCDVCDRLIGNGRYWTLAKTNTICEACKDIPQRCIHCSMPVKIGFASTSDGRYICRRHVPLVVLEEREATSVFRDAKDELRRIARGEMELIQPEIPVKLFDTDYWSSKEDAANPDALHKIGFSRTTWANGLTNHSIVMLSGQLRTTLAAVSAHEYTHLWINENRPATHVIEPETVEGICELAAWKLMQARALPEEQARIEANSYTKGRVNRLIETEARIGFDAVLDWVKHGTGPTLTGSEASPSAKPDGPNATALAIWRAASRAPRPPTHETLHLDGLFERSDRTVAMINGVTVEAGSAAEIRLNGELIKVLIDSITNRTVLIRTNGHPVSLSLDPN